MTRISILTEANMNEEQKSTIADAKAAGQPHGGPFWAYIRNPKLMRTIQEVGKALAEGTLTPREQSLIVLSVARYWDAAFPWAVQVRNALNIGISEDMIDAINDQIELPSDDAREKLVHKVSSELLTEHGLSNATYAKAETIFSEDELIALIARIGSFSMTCCTANAFDITPPAEAPARLR